MVRQAEVIGDSPIRGLTAARSASKQCDLFKPVGQ
jgi:hypothetical protein